MQGYNTLWMPGTDHAGIATQAVVERRSSRRKARRGTTWAARSWSSASGSGRSSTKREFSASSSKWAAAATGSGRGSRWTTCAPGPCATPSSTCSRSRLIYRGKRLVNWDTFLQTAVSDDEVFHETSQGPLLALPLSGHRPAAGRADARDDRHDAARDDAGRHGRGRASRSRPQRWTEPKRSCTRSWPAAPAKEQAGNRRRSSTSWPQRRDDVLPQLETAARHGRRRPQADAAAAAIARFR